MMLQISEEELLRRLLLVKNIRKQYIARLLIEEDEIPSSYKLLDNLESAEYINVCVDKKFKYTSVKVTYGKYSDEETIVTYDPVIAAQLNTGEQQGYWGSSYTVQGKFKKNIGTLYIDERIIEKDCTDDLIREIEKEKIKEALCCVILLLESNAETKRNKIKKAQSNLETIEKRLKNLKILGKEI